MNIIKCFESITGINEEEKEIISFGLNMMVTSIVALIVAVIISFAMGMVLEGAFLLISIIALRQYAGGYHAKSQGVCAIISGLIYSSCLFFIKSGGMTNDIIQLVLCVLSIIILFVLAPVDNECNELSMSEKSYLRKKLRIVLTIEVMIFVLLLISGNAYWSGIVVVSMIIVAALVLIGDIINNFTS